MGKGRVQRPPSDGGRRDRNERQNRGPLRLSNEKLEKYYKLQNIADETELAKIFDAFRQPLPTTFRVTGSRANAEDVNEVIKGTYVPFMSNVVYEGQKQPAPRQIPWYPGGLAWEVNVGKNVIRRSHEFKKFQTFLVHETDAGNMSRQEAVSMIPPLLLDVEPEHYVLDMCAAPGSKSAQLVEALHAKPDVEPTGFLLANDSDAKRTHMLVHQTLGRIGSPNMMVTNLDASQLPNIRTTISGKMRILRFDRVLADVPCTGDGTLRKNADIWRRWTPNEANSLHALQLRILTRGLQQLKPGGRMVYSTCSLNPIENEAVVSAVLRDLGDSVMLVDISDRLPELKRYPGLHTWSVMNESITPLQPPEHGEKEKIVNGKSMLATLWPSGREEELHLERCARIYPHLQDTGGFFIAVLVKAGGNESESLAPVITAPEPLPPLANTVQNDSDAGGARAAGTETVSDSERPAKRQKLDADTAEVVKAEGNPGREFKEDPFGYVPTTNTEMQDTLKYFGITRSFDRANLLVRNTQGEPLRTVYHTSASVRAIVTSNDYKRLRLVSCGAKLLGRQDPNKSGVYECRWRLMSDSVAFVRPHMTDGRIIQGGIKTLRQLMDHYVPTERFEEAPFREGLKRVGNGSALLEITPSKDEYGSRRTILWPIWQAPTSIQLMADKKQKSALSCRIFGSDISSRPPPRQGKVNGQASTEGADTKMESQQGLSGHEAEGALREDAEIEDDTMAVPALDVKNSTHEPELAGVEGATEAD